MGESGCGKTTLGRTILRLIEPTSGEIIFNGRDIRKLSVGEMRHMRREMQIIFQDPFSSLNPRKTIAETIEEPILLAGLIQDSDKRFMRVLDLMDTVGLPIASSTPIPTSSTAAAASASASPGPWP